MKAVKPSGVLSVELTEVVDPGVNFRVPNRSFGFQRDSTISWSHMSTSRLLKKTVEELSSLRHIVICTMMLRLCVRTRWGMKVDSISLFSSDKLSSSRSILKEMGDRAIAILNLHERWTGKVRWFEYTCYGNSRTANLTLLKLFDCAGRHTR
jgi:hypothetical protein